MSVGCLTVGSRIAYEGGVWTVVGLEGERVTVEEQGSGRSCAVRLAHLLAAPGSRLLEPPDARPSGSVGPVLANLTESELAAVSSAPVMSASF